MDLIIINFLRFGPSLLIISSSLLYYRHQAPWNARHKSWKCFSINKMCELQSIGPPVISFSFLFLGYFLVLNILLK